MLARGSMLPDERSWASGGNAPIEGSPSEGRAERRALRRTSVPRVFPPALVPVLRSRFGSRSGGLDQLEDDLLVDLITTVFFAGLETHEGLHHPIRVVFMGRSAVDIVMPEGADLGAAPMYRWKVLRFEAPRPFVIPELVKLAAARTGERLYTAVRILDNGHIAIAGLAREGFKGESDPFIEIVATRPGRLSIRSGRDCLIEYERGTIVGDGPQLAFSAPPVRHALECAARAAGLEEAGVPEYVDAVRALVGQMASHGRGGILVISRDEQPRVAELATYRMARDSSISALLRLSRRLRRSEERRRHPAEVPHAPSYGILLRDAFAAEIRRFIEEYAALTGIDGATVLSCSLALVAFGVVLPVGPEIVVSPAEAGLERRTIDLAARGTRHRAAATYAGAHPGSVVFVASEDGPVSCMLCERQHEPVMWWHFGPIVADRSGAPG